MAMVDYKGAQEEAYSKIKNYMECEKPLDKYGGGHTDWNDSAKCVSLKGKGFEGKISIIGQGERSQIELDLKLNFMLKAFGKTIEQQVLSHIHRALNKA